MKTVGYAIVGTGYFGAELGRIMKEQEGAKIVAVLDPENGQTIADELGCDVETDLDTLYSRDDVDAVIVATPNYLHGKSLSGTWSDFYGRTCYELFPWRKTCEEID